MEEYISNRYGYCYYDMEFKPSPIIFNLFIYEDYRRKKHGTNILKTVIFAIRHVHNYSGDILIEVSPQKNSIPKDILTNLYKKLGLKIF